MSRQVFESVPGLFVYPDHFSPVECGELVPASLAVYARLVEAAARTGRVEKAHIPQPGYVRSERHNLASAEYYTRVVLEEAGGRSVGCEFFPRYGEAGHALAYFRGTDNLPDFVRDGPLGRIRRRMEEAGLVAGRELVWKLTMNFYENVGGTVAGFPFHVDIPANGVVTMILNVQREALFQIAKGDAAVDVRLPVGAPLVLSGESRYEWKHRVLPMPGLGAGGGVERVSLVLGFQ